MNIEKWTVWRVGGYWFVHAPFTAQPRASFLSWRHALDYAMSEATR